MGKCSKVIVLGLNHFYLNELYNVIDLWARIGKIQIVSYVEDNYILHNYRGIPVRKPQEIQDIEYEYIIVANGDYRRSCYILTNKYHVNQEKIINGQVFLNQMFDWDRYIKVKKSNITIIAESCYGGLCYNRLGLRFLSPFVNIRINQYEYLRLLSNFYEYIREPLRLIRGTEPLNDLGIVTQEKDIDWGFGGYPVFELGDVLINAVHAHDESEFKQKWEERCERINYSNLFVMMVIENDEIAERFSALPFEHKAGFYYKDTGLKDIIFLKEYQNPELRYQYNYHFRKYVHSLFFNIDTLKTIDVLKLLNYEQDYYKL